MLSGNPLKAMILFALPLIATGVLQQSFNSVDIAIAGRYVGHKALAAVGSNGPVIGLIINMFMGLAVGVNVVIANYIGQGNLQRVRRAVGASAFLALISGAIMLVTTISVARPLLEALDTPAEVLDQAAEYLCIMGYGMPFMIIYNFGAATLRSIGDTKRPFYILLVSGFINVGLNFLFVAGMGWGVEGVAWGTFISNGINAAAVTYLLIKSGGEVTLDPSLIRPFKEELGKVCRIGLPAGLQATVFSFSNVFILSAINSFGALASAGSAAALNYEVYTYYVISAFAQTATAFTGQNYGAGQTGRIRRIFLLSLVMSVVSSGVLAALIAWHRDFFLSIFSSDSSVLDFGGVRIMTVLLFQFVACYYEISGATMRGMGHSMTPALITIGGTCVLRLLWVGFFPTGASFGALLTVYPVSWILTDIMMWLAFRHITHCLKGWKE